MTLTRTGENKGYCTNQALSIQKKIGSLDWKFFSCKKDEDRGQLGVEATEILRATPNLVAESMMRFATNELRRLNSAALNRSLKKPFTNQKRSSSDRYPHLSCRSPSFFSKLATKGCTRFDKKTSALILSYITKIKSFRKVLEVHKEKPKLVWKQQKGLLTKR
jgi:hypothetical protein